jgi:hypothetical protein
MSGGMLARSVVALGFFVACSAGVQRAEAQFSELVNKVPEDANVLMMVDLTKILGSQISSEGDWAKKLREAQAAGISNAPRGSSSFLVAAQMDLEFQRTIWEATLVRFASGAPSIDNIAAKFGAKAERLSGHDTVLLPDDSLLVAFGADVLGAHIPGNRQEVSRWLHDVDSPSGGRVSPYLQRAEGYAVEVGTPVVMALDLTDALTEAQITDKLGKMKSLEGKSFDAQKAAEVLSSIQGVTLGATVGKTINASIRVDFAQDIEPIKDFAIDLLWEALGNHHAMLDDFSQFTGKASGRTVQVSGTLTPASLRQILSLLTAAPALSDALKKDASELVATDDETKVREASKVYFEAIDESLQDMIGKRGTGQMKTFGQVALWWQNAARSLERRSTLNVDPDLVAWGAQMISAMRDTSDTLRGVGMKTAVANTQIVGNFDPATGGTGFGPGSANSYNRNYGYGGGNAGWGAAVGYAGVPGFVAGPSAAGYRAAWNQEAAREDLAAVGSQRAAVRTQLKVAGAANAQEIVRRMEESVAEERRRLTEKFGVEF